MGAMGEASARSSRLQSPTRFSRLGSNDDDLERAQARADARRRKSLALRAHVAGEGETIQEESDLMDKDQIMDLFHNCIKLASENKINQKNTWELGLIDHLSEIIKVDSDEDNETNFQKASCTLEAGVKIYSLRVDSVHSEAYKVLAGINRAGRDEEDKGSENKIDEAGDEVSSKKEPERKVSPTSTLESSFEALNVKKFDVAFTVDPLYHQTSAQFDEGGAKGLLLYNLGVYGSCHVIFDSLEVPENCLLTSQNNNSPNKTDQTIDLSFAKESIENMMGHVPNAKEISPTLREIIELFDDENQRPDNISSSDQGPGLTEEASVNEDITSFNYENDNNNDFNHENDNGFNYDNDDGESVIDEGSTNVNSANYQEDIGEFTSMDPNGHEKLEKIADFLSLGLGFSSKNNAWAGPDHWKFRKIKGSSEPVSDESTEKPEILQKRTRKNKALPDIDFSKPIDKNSLKLLFAPPKNPKSLLLPANRTPCKIRLPEDCHYRPESLVKLFLLPDIMCLGRKGRNQTYEFNEENNDGFVAHESSWDDDMSDNGNDHYALEEPVSLLRKPRQVNKIDIQYDKVSKQVDVHALKGVLWTHIQDSAQGTNMENEMGEKEAASSKVTFSKILEQFPNESPKEISPHLFFICLLHLANEHCLTLHDRPTLDEIDIEIPSSSLFNMTP